MKRRSRTTGRAAFSLRDMLVAVGVIGIMIALLLPNLEESRGAYRRRHCSNNTKQLPIALHNYHDAHRRFPHLTSTQIRGVVPGSVAADGNPGAGFSWHVAVLPYCEEVKLFKDIEHQTDGFKLSPFDPNVKSGVIGSNGSLAPMGASPIDAFKCLSRNSGDFATAPEYVSIGKQYVARCSYVAVSATHLDCMLGDPNSSDHVPPNGIIIPGPTEVDLKLIKVCTSKTIAIAESREERYSSWYDGTVAWVVAMRPDEKAPKRDGSGWLCVEAGQSTAVNIGPSRHLEQVYLPKNLHGLIAVDWAWGPSSEHNGFTVIHGIADGSVRDLKEDIDPTLYLRLVTRSDSERASLPK
jgi:hypothetical protein